MGNHIYTVIGLRYRTFDTLADARKYVKYCLHEKDDLDSTAIRGALGMSNKIICRRNIYTDAIRYFNYK